MSTPGSLLCSLGAWALRASALRFALASAFLAAADFFVVGPAPFVYDTGRKERHGLATSRASALSTSAGAAHLVRILGRRMVRLVLAALDLLRDVRLDLGPCLPVVLEPVQAADALLAVRGDKVVLEQVRLDAFFAEGRPPLGRLDRLDEQPRADRAGERVVRRRRLAHLGLGHELWL
jgi:hypothetical protein